MIYFVARSRGFEINPFNRKVTQFCHFDAGEIFASSSTKIDDFACVEWIEIHPYNIIRSSGTLYKIAY